MSHAVDKQHIRNRDKRRSSLKGVHAKVGFLTDFDAVPNLIKRLNQRLNHGDFPQVDQDGYEEV